MADDFQTASKSNNNDDENFDLDEDYQENYGENDPILIRNRRMNAAQTIEAMDTNVHGSSNSMAIEAENPNCEQDVEAMDSTVSVMRCDENGFFFTVLTGEIGEIS